MYGAGPRGLAARRGLKIGGGEGVYGGGPPPQPQPDILISLATHLEIRDRHSFKTLNH